MSFSNKFQQGKGEAKESIEETIVWVEVGKRGPRLLVCTDHKLRMTFPFLSGWEEIKRRIRDKYLGFRFQRPDTQFVGTHRCSFVLALFSLLSCYDGRAE